MKIIHNINDRKRFVLINKMKATIKKIFDMKSKKGIYVAGKTIKLDKI